MPGIVQGTEYTIMNKTGLFPVLVRLNLEKKIGQKKKKVNKHTITNCGTCSKGNKYCVVGPREINIV